MVYANTKLMACIIYNLNLDYIAFLHETSEDRNLKIIY